MKIYIVDITHYELGEEAPRDEEQLFFLNKANADQYFNNINPVEYIGDARETQRDDRYGTLLKIYTTDDHMNSLWVQLREMETRD